MRILLKAAKKINFLSYFRLLAWEMDSVAHWVPCIQPSYPSFNSNKDNIKKETDNVNWCPLLGQLLFKYCGEQQQHCTSKQIWTILCHVITLIYQSQINAGYCPGAPPWRRDLRCWARTVRARTVEQTKTCGNRERGRAFLYGGLYL